MSKIFMKRGLSSAYNALSTKNADTLYFLTDTGAVYLGDKKVNADELAALTSALNGLKIFSTVNAGGYNITAANSSSILKIAEGDNVKITVAEDGTITIAADFTAELNGKVDKETGKGLSANDFTDELKAKLEGIEDEANKTVVDSALSDSSTNPVENKAVKSALDTKVDKVDGKQLSTEDYTTAEKTKLSGIAEGAQVNVIETVKVNGVNLAPTSKAVDITVPTDNAQLTNGAGYLVAADIADKADKATTLAGYGISDAYTKTDVNEMFANTESTLTGDLQDYTDNAIKTLEETYLTGEGAQGVIDTLNEIANWIADDEAGAAKVVQDIEDLKANKVDKVDGKGLSTNDYDNTEKQKVADAYAHSQEAHAPANAQANVIESVKVNGVALTVSDKAVDVSVPTDNAQLANGAGYLVAADIANKVDKVEGKQLSTEDFTTAEKTKLAGIEENANNYVHPTDGSIVTNAFVKVTVNTAGHVTGTTTVVKSDIATIVGEATTSANGLMSADDKVTLNSVDDCTNWGTF